MKPLLLAALLTACASPAAVSELTVIDSPTRSRSATAVLISTSGDRSTWLTAAHPLVGATSRDVAVGTYRARDFEAHPTLDRATVTTDATSASPIPVAPWTLRAGDRVVIRTLAGDVPAIVRHNGLIAADGSIGPGDSGAPVLHDGSVVAIVVGSGKESAEWTVSVVEAR